MYYKRSIACRGKKDKRRISEPLIYIRASWCGHRVEYATPHSISEEQWDAKKQRARGIPTLSHYKDTCNYVITQALERIYTVK